MAKAKKRNSKCPVETISVIASCHTCGKRFEYYKTAKYLAELHVKQTGHKVSGEATRYFSYG